MKKRGHPTRVETAKRKREAFDLRLSGMSYDSIGERLGISKQGAYTLVMSVLDENERLTAETAEKVRGMEIDRVDAILERLWPMRGDPRTADTILRAAERRARLLGLDAPTKSDVLVTEVMNDEQRVSAAAALFDAARARAAGQDPGK